MKSKPVHPLEIVETDIERAIDFYAGWRSDARNHVLELYEAVIQKIFLNPNQFSEKHGAVRRAILRRSFYLVYYIQELDRSVVLAVLDGRINPRKTKSIVRSRIATIKKDN